MFNKKKDNKKKILHSEPVHEPVSITDGKSRRIISSDITNQRYIIDLDEDFEDLDAIEDTLENRELKATEEPDIETESFEIEEGSLEENYPEEDLRKNEAAEVQDSVEEQSKEARMEEVRNAIKASKYSKEHAGKAKQKADVTDKKIDKAFSKSIGGYKSKLLSLKKKYIGNMTWKDLWAGINPPSPSGVDPQTDYIMRVLVFLFPLYIYETGGFMGINGKNIFLGIIILVMALWCTFRAVRISLFKNAVNSPGALAAGVSFLIVALTFIVQVVKASPEVPHTYQYLGCFLLAFSAMFVGRCSRYYLQLFAASISLIYIGIFRYIFTVKATLLGSEELLSNPMRLISILLLGISTGAVLYLTEKNKNLEKLYLVFIAVGEIILFLYGNVLAFVITFLFIVGLQFTQEPTQRFIKKNMILLFMFGFCASNTPLLTYFSLKGLNKTFDLEYSIYIDIVIAVLGLIVTNYWEKLPKDKDENVELMPVFAKWYKRSLALIAVLLLVTVVYGSRADGLMNAFGGKAVSGLAGSLWKALSGSNGEFWYILSKYGLIGIAIMLTLGVIIFRKTISVWREGKLDEVGKGYAFITIMFVFYSLFFPFDAASTPIFMIIAGLVISSQSLGEVLEKNHDIEMTPSRTGEKKQEGTGVKSKKKSAFQTYDQNILGRIDADVDEVKDTKGREKLKGYANFTAYILVSAMASILLLLIITGLYRVVVPVTEKGANIDSLVTVAIEHQKEALLAEQPVEPVNDEVAATEATSEEEVLVADNDQEKEEVTEDSEQEEVVEEPEESEEAEDTEETEENAETEETEENAENQEFADIEAGISHGNYRIFDPNANYKEVDEEIRGVNGGVNLRTLPSLAEDVEVVHKLTEEEKARRIGIGENGWSKIVYEGQELFAVTEYIITEADYAKAQEEARAREEARAQEEAERAQAEQEQEDSKNDSKDSKKNEPATPPKGAANYTVHLADNKKDITIWSAGKKYGTMTVTNEEGTVMELVNNGVYTTGTGDKQKRYLNITTAKDITKPMTLNVDAGFIEAVRNMGYSGVYFNKNLNNW